MKKVKKYLCIILIIFLITISFFLGQLYVVADVYYSSKKVKGYAEQFYRLVVISEYLEYTFDNSAPYTIDALEPCIKNLPIKDRFSFYKAVLLTDRVKTSGGLGTSIAETIIKDKAALSKYLIEYEKTKEYKQLSKEEKDNIHYNIKSLF